MKRIVWAEPKSRALARCRIEFLNCIRKTAGRTHDRHGSVAHAVHLVQAARFILRRHQKNIGAGFDEMRKPVVIAHSEGSLPGICGDESSRADSPFPCFRRPAERKRHILRQKIVQNSNQKVQALLNIDARNHREERTFQPCFIQAELPKNGLFVLPLALQVVAGLYVAASNGSLAGFQTS